MIFVAILAVPGATLLLAGSSPAARHVIDAAFDRQGPQGHGKQLVSELATCFSLVFWSFQPNMDV